MSARHRPADCDTWHDPDVRVTRSYRLADLTDEQRAALELLEHDGNGGTVRLNMREWRALNRVANALSGRRSDEEGLAGIGTPQERPGTNEGVA